MAKALTITAHPKPEAGWVHRFRNFGEDVCDRLRGLSDANIAAVDAAFEGLTATAQLSTAGA
jgi:hypothetical protein